MATEQHHFNIVKEDNNDTKPTHIQPHSKQYSLTANTTAEIPQIPNYDQPFVIKLTITDGADKGLELFAYFKQGGATSQSDNNLTGTLSYNDKTSLKDAPVVFACVVPSPSQFELVFTSDTNKELGGFRSSNPMNFLTFDFQPVKGEQIDSDPAV